MRAPHHSTAVPFAEHGHETLHANYCACRMLGLCTHGRTWIMADGDFLSSSLSVYAPRLFAMAPSCAFIDPKMSLAHRPYCMGHACTRCASSILPGRSIICCWLSHQYMLQAFVLEVAVSSSPRLISANRPTGCTARPTQELINPRLPTSPATCPFTSPPPPPPRLLHVPHSLLTPLHPPHAHPTSNILSLPFPPNLLQPNPLPLPHTLSFQHGGCQNSSHGGEDVVAAFSYARRVAAAGGHVAAAHFPNTHQHAPLWPPQWVVVCGRGGPGPQPPTSTRGWRRRGLRWGRSISLREGHLRATDRLACR